MEFLTAQQVMEKRASIRQAFDRLVTTRALVARPRARQWRFFRACAAVLLGEENGDIAEFATIAGTTAAQYKFEIEAKLSRYYQSPGKRHTFVFALAHASRLGWYDLQAETYPCMADYALLVRQPGEAETIGEQVAGPQLEAYLERVIAEAMTAELQAYLSLPEPDLSALPGWFVEESPAMREIANVVAGCSRRGWSLQSPMNPSTCRLLSVAVKKVSARDAEVATREYWYLRWWDCHKKKYTYPYRETNQQLYILKKTGEKWRIYQNMRPAPRTSQPLRWKRSR